jgi:hypothetical protein
LPQTSTPASLSSPPEPPRGRRAASVKASSSLASYSLRHLRSTLSVRLCSRQSCVGR